MHGYVRSFSDLRGYGFITGSDGSDYFVHHSMIEADGYRSLDPGDRVSFQPVKTPRGWQAWQVTRLSDTHTGQAPFRLKLNPFTPQDPVTDPHRFAGRTEPLANAIDCLFNNKNLIVTGARGIGKSSLAYQLLNLTRGDRTLLDRIGVDTMGFQFNHLTGDHRCLPGHSLTSIAQGLITSLRANSEFSADPAAEVTTTEWNFKIFKSTTERARTPEIDELALSFALAIEQGLKSTTSATTGVTFLIDEIDVLDGEVQIAPFLKAVTEKLRLDQFSNVSFVLSGVTGTITELISQHPSATRLTESLTLQAMTAEELGSIIDIALRSTDTSITDEAKEAIIELSANFPAPVQLLGYHSFRSTSDEIIDLEDVVAARDFVIREIKRQDFDGRLEKLGGGLTVEILRSLSGPSRRVTLERIVSKTGQDRPKVSSVLGELRGKGYVHRRGSEFELAEPLFRIYLRWLFGIS